jgi:FkbM family methyltransferase
MLTVFDLGANGGGFPLMLLLSGKRFSKLVCVEMNPNTFRRLQYNISRNVEGETVLIQGAVCGSRRKFELALGQGDISDSIYQDHTDASLKSRQKYEIEGYSFDDLFRSHFGESVVDICKLDIEGAEYEVFSSPEHTGLRLCRYLIVELRSAVDQRRQLRNSKCDWYVKLNQAITDFPRNAFITTTNT